MQDFQSYGMLTLSTVMFSFMFWFKDMFRKNYGSGIRATLTMTFGGGIFGFIALAIINGLKFEFSIFALIMAVLVTLNSLLFSFFSFKALDNKPVLIFIVLNVGWNGIALSFGHTFSSRGADNRQNSLLCDYCYCPLYDHRKR